MEDRGQERADHGRLPTGELLRAVQRSGRAGIKGVDARCAARVEPHDVEAECLGERQVLTLGVGDGDPPTEHRA